MNTTLTPQATAAIAVEGLTKRYGNVTAVDDLSFTVRPGAVTGFLGPNGAGKTTALTGDRRAFAADRRPCTDQRHADRRGDARRADARCLHRVVRRPSRAGRRGTTCARSRRWPGCRAPGSTRCSRPSGSSKRPGAGSASTPRACASGSGSGRRCWATRRSSFWTSRSTASTRRAFAGCAPSCVNTPQDGRDRPALEPCPDRGGPDGRRRRRDQQGPARAPGDRWRRFRGSVAAAASSSARPRVNALPRQWNRPVGASRCRTVAGSWSRGWTPPQLGELAHDERVVLHELVPRGGSLEDVFFNLTEEEAA